jgi:enoyl-[acyl-carrier protein] reductase I
VAFARAEDLGGRLIDTSAEGFRTALDISAYSLSALARHAEPHLRAGGGGSVMALSYIAADRAVPGYNVMGVAKAALEATARYLAFDLGDRKVRVNCISAGPIRTLAAMGVGGIDEMLEYTPKKAPLKRNVDADEVGKTAVYLLSELSSGVTGETLYVDAGFNTVGL